MNLTLTELRTLLKLLSSVPDGNGWYDIRSVKDKVTRRNNVSVHISRLKKNKKLLESSGSNFYKPTEECWKVLESLYGELGAPLAKLLETHEKTQKTS